MKQKIRNVLCILLCLMLCGCGQQEETLLDAQEGESICEFPSEETLEQEETETVQTVNTVFVHVCGAVCSPGVYEVASDSRIYEVLNLAGGLLSTADDEYLNQAETVTDGLKLYVPTWEETAAGSVAEPVPRAADTQSTSLVNINTADASMLTTLRGVGESRAQSIIAYREENGAFSKIEDIMNVTGIKEGLFQKIKDQITVGAN